MIAFTIKSKVGSGVCVRFEFAFIAITQIRPKEFKKKFY